MDTGYITMFTVEGLHSNTECMACPSRNMKPGTEIIHINTVTENIKKNCIKTNKGGTME